MMVVKIVLTQIEATPLDLRRETDLLLADLNAKAAPNCKVSEADSKKEDSEGSSN